MRFEIANGEEIPNLGAKLMPVMTMEGAWCGVQVEVADISKALQSFRRLFKTGHAVIVGGGGIGDEHHIQNRHTGEVNVVKDDGLN